MAWSGQGVNCPAELRQWVLDNAPNYNIQGLSLTVMLADGTNCHLQYGYRNTQKKEKVDVDTLFNAASISKPLTAYVALKIFSEHSLNINASINQFLRSWKLTAPKEFEPEKVTLSNLLNHSAGITGFRCKGYKMNQAFPTLLNALSGEKPANTPAVTMISKPDDKFLYSPASYMIAEQVLEDITHQPYAQIMKNQLLQPLHMNQSTFKQPLPKSLLKDIAWPYLPDGNKIENGPLSFIAATGGLWTTSEDLTQFLRAIQHASSGKPGSVLQQKLTDLYLKPKLTDNWGLGIQVNLDKYGNEVKQGNYFGHGGFNSGYLSFMLASNTEPVGYAVLINTAPLMSTKGEVVQFGFIKSLNKKIADLYKWR